MIRYILIGLLLLACVPFILGSSCIKQNYEPYPWVYAITPSEAQSGDFVYIKGRELWNTEYEPALIDPEDYNNVLPKPIDYGRSSHSFAVQIPPGFTTWKKYWLVMQHKGNPFVWSKETVPTKSHAIWLGGYGSSHGERLRAVYIHPTWDFWCDDNGNNCNTPPMHEILPQPAHGFPTDWGSQPWRDYALLINQSSRDWSTMCSAAWSSPTPHGYAISAGVHEMFEREAFIYNPWFWLETARDLPFDPGGEHWLGSGALRVLARGEVPIYLSEVGRYLRVCDPYYNPGECNYQGVMMRTALVVFVGAFFYYGEEVDPNNPISGFRAMTGTASPSLIDDEALGMPELTDTHGMMLFSRSPAKGFFPNPDGGGSLEPLVAALNWCNRDRCWFGPSYSADTTPNLMSHELAHLYTGRPDYPSLQAHLEHTPFIISDLHDFGHYRRGFNLHIPTLGATPYSECRAARLGVGKDFTD